MTKAWNKLAASVVIETLHPLKPLEVLLVSPQLTIHMHTYIQFDGLHVSMMFHYFYLYSLGVLTQVNIATGGGGVPCSLSDYS